SRCDHQRYPSEAKPRRRLRVFATPRLVDFVFFVFFVAEYTCKRLPRFWRLCVSAFRYLERHQVCELRDHGSTEQSAGSLISAIVVHEEEVAERSVGDFEAQ